MRFFFRSNIDRHLIRGVAGLREERYVAECVEIMHNELAKPTNIRKGPYENPVSCFEILDW